jgi:phage terminase large subunit-like protein
VWNPAEWHGSIPRAEVMAAVDEVCRTYKVKQAFCDPPGWWSEIGEWSAKYGEKTFFEWWTNRPAAMHDALERNLVDLRTGRSTHDDCRLAAMCASNARKLARPSQRYILGKPSQHQKIDVTMADVLAHEAACDAREGGWTAPGKPVVPRRIR